MSTSSSPTTVDRLLEGDERAFQELIDRHHANMIQYAKSFVDDASAAEEVVQETWTTVIDELETYEGRSKLETWIYGILTNLAHKRADKEGRELNWSSVSDKTLDGEVSRDDDRFAADGRWSTPPKPWRSNPESEYLRSELRDRLRKAIEDLPARQQAVVTLRDVQGWSPDEVCEVLEITDGNQRVLLHRGRSKVRDALEAFLGEEVSE